MNRPRLLDAFCGAGGASFGYHLAGFDVVGVDIAPMPRYPFEFHQGDAIEYLAEHWREFDAIHASPPCQAFSTMTPDKTRHPRLIAPIQMMLRHAGLPYVIENVVGAKKHLHEPVMLCGSSFGLGVRRHRYFETSAPVWQPPCDHAAQGTPVGVYGQHPDSAEFLRPNGTRRGAKATSLQEGRDAMGIQWMNWPELAESIPPAFTEHVGRALLETLESAA